MIKNIPKIFLCALKYVKSKLIINYSLNEYLSLQKKKKKSGVLNICPKGIPFGFFHD
jgi:hypothetical protein